MTDLSDRIDRWPGMDTCMRVAESFSEENRWYEYHKDQLNLVSRIPFALRTELITLDHDKIDEMGLTCRYDDRWCEFDDPIVKEFKWGAVYESSILSEDPEWEENYYRDQNLRKIAEEIQDICRKGFITRPVYGYRMEEVDRDPIAPTLIEYIEGPEMPDVDLPDTEERQYEVGTRRYGVDGVVTDREWWKEFSRRLRT